MSQGPKTNRSNRENSKSLLSTLKLTTTIGAVSLTLAGWGLLSGADAFGASAVAQAAPESFSGSAPTALLTAAGQMPLPMGGAPSLGIAPASLATATSRVVATATKVAPAATTAPPTATGAPVAQDAPAAAPTSTVEPTATAKFKLDVVQWVKTQAGDPVAVVRDNRGVLWYVWGDDVPLIEQGLAPQYQPQPVNSVTRSRRS